MVFALLLIIYHSGGSAQDRMHSSRHFFAGKQAKQKERQNSLRSVSPFADAFAPLLSHFKGQAICALLLCRICFMRTDGDAVQRAQVLCVLVVHTLVYRASDGLVTTMTHFTSLLPS